MEELALFGARVSLLGGARRYKRYTSQSPLWNSHSTRGTRHAHVKFWGAITEHNYSTEETPYHPKLQTQELKGLESGRMIRMTIPNNNKKILDSLKILGRWQKPLTRLIYFSKPLYGAGIIFILKRRIFYAEGFGVLLRVMGLSRDPPHSEPEGSRHPATRPGTPLHSG